MTGVAHAPGVGACPRCGGRSSVDKTYGRIRERVIYRKRRCVRKACSTAWWTWERDCLPPPGVERAKKPRALRTEPEEPHQPAKRPRTWRDDFQDRIRDDSP